MVNPIFDKAKKAGRDYLYENEVYQLLTKFNIPVPKFQFIPTHEIENFNLKIEAPYYVLKAIIKDKIHKTDIGAIELKIKKGKILSPSPLPLSPKGEGKRSKTKELYYKFKDDPGFEGILVVEYYPHEKGITNEFIIGVKKDYAFSHCLTIGPGGTTVEALDKYLNKETSWQTIPIGLLSENAFNENLIFNSLTGKLRGVSAKISSKYFFDYLNKIKTIIDAENEIIEFELNPAIVHDKNIIPLDGYLKFGSKKDIPKPTKKQNIEKLLNPKTVGIIGASAKNSFAPCNTIIKNLLDAGFTEESINIVRPKGDSILGINTITNLNEIKDAVDLFIVGIPVKNGAAEFIKELVARKKTKSILAISAGFGETREGKKRGAELRKLFQNTDIILNGPNTLGNVSGKISTFFTPKYKSGGTNTGKSNVALICQSGAFASTRASDLGEIISPKFLISTGNQIDLSMTDFLTYVLDDKEINVIGIYVEGLKELEGKKLLDLIKKARKKNKLPILYKAGKIPKTAKLISGHTASIAGSFQTFKSAVGLAGGIVAENIKQFEEYLKIASLLSDCKFNFSIPIKIAALSNAGFEKCVLGDNLIKDKIELANLSEKTKNKINEIFNRKGLANIIDTADILDLTPMSDDSVFSEIIEVLLNDKNVDCGVFSLVPETIMLKIEPAGSNKEKSIYNKNSIIQKLIKIRKQLKKPFVVSIESGKIYEHVRHELEKNNIPCFQKADEACSYFLNFLLAHIL